MVNNNQQVNFQFYRQGELWYVTDSGFSFPVPIADTGTGIFLARDKAIIFMRYIRKQLQSVKEQDELNEQERKKCYDAH